MINDTNRFSSSVIILGCGTLGYQIFFYAVRTTKVRMKREASLKEYLNKIDFRHTAYPDAVGSLVTKLQGRKMDFVATPYHTINKNFLISIGLWPHQTGISKYFFLFTMLFFTMSQGYFQIGGMIAAWDDKDVFLESIPPVLVDFVCGAKIINFIVNSAKMKQLLLILENDWKRFKGRCENEIMNRYAIFGRRLTLFHVTWMYGSMTPFMLLPIVPIIQNMLSSSNATQAKQLMFRVDFLMDAEKYYYPLLIHSYFGTMAYISCVIAIDTMIITFVQHACGSFAILGYQLEHLTDGVDIDLDVYPRKNDDITYNNMANCVAQHNHALEYSALIENANYVSYFFQLGFMMICISFTGFQTVMQLDRPDISARYAGFTATEMCMLFFQSYPAQILFDHSIRVSEYVHNSGWYLTSIRTRKLASLMTMRSRIPCVLTAGKFYILNLANFSAVVRTSLSYLTVLTSVK